MVRLKLSSVRQDNERLAYLIWGKSRVAVSALAILVLEAQLAVSNLCL